MSMKLTGKCAVLEYVGVENNVKNDGKWYEGNTKLRLQILNTKQTAAGQSKAEGYCPCALMKVTAEEHKHRFITFC